MGTFRDHSLIPHVHGCPHPQPWVPTAWQTQFPEALTSKGVRMRSRGGGRLHSSGRRWGIRALRRHRPETCCWVLLGLARAGCLIGVGRTEEQRIELGPREGSWPSSVSPTSLLCGPANYFPSLPPSLLPFLSFNFKIFTKITLDVYSAYQSSLMCVL